MCEVFRLSINTEVELDTVLEKVMNVFESFWINFPRRCQQVWWLLSAEENLNFM